MMKVLVLLPVAVLGLVSPGVKLSRPALTKLSSTAALTVADAPAAPVRGFFDRFDDYKETSRAFRRTVYGADEWRKHRSTKRYFRALQTSPFSGVLRGLALELILIGGIAFGVCFLSAAGIFHAAMPALPLTLTAPALGLLITFRTNQAYGRWWEARKIWGAVINKTRDLTRQSHWFKDTKRAERFSALAIAFGFALNAHCLKGTISQPFNHIKPYKTVDEKLEAELSSLMTPDKVKEILAAPHRPVEVCRLLTQCLAQEGLTPQLEARIDETIAFYSDFGGMCDRLQKTPMPLVYTRHTARALSIWLGLVPCALLGAGLGTTTIVLSSLGIATLMFGIDELGIQIEEPFSVLPMDSYCNGLKALHDYTSWTPSPNPPRHYM